ncbi:hypothetical protein BDK62_104195 [Halomonas alkaliantarctica]|nr:hypothetical protein BDK62_104195 [Halomonas alkaliantarctica]
MNTAPDPLDTPGALPFVDQHAVDYVGSVNLLVAPVRDRVLLPLDLDRRTPCLPPL